MATCLFPDPDVKAWPAFRWTLARVDEGEELQLSPREAQLLSALAFPARKTKWLAGRKAAKRLLREALAWERGVVVPEHALTVANEPSGAPFAELEGEGRLPWALSISHRGSLGLAALVTTPGVRLGVDLEVVEPRDAALVRTFFTEHEQAVVAAASGRMMDLYVARTWSAKEAVLKALGLGLRLDTREVEIRGEGAGTGADGWRVLEVVLGPNVPEAPCAPFAVGWRDEGDHVLSVALERPAEKHEAEQLFRWPHNPGPVPYPTHGLAPGTLGVPNSPATF